MKNDKNLSVDQTFNLAVRSHQNNNLQDAQNYYQKVLKIDPNHVSTLYNLGVMFKDLGEYQKAISFYEKVIKIDPNHALAHNNLGVMFKVLGDNQKAISFYEKVIEIDPNFVNAYNNLGIIFQELGKIQKAISFYEKVIKIDPNHVTTLYNLGIIFKDLEKIQKAISFYEKTIKVDPNYANAHNNLGVIFQELGEYHKAKNCYEKVIKIDPNHINAHNNLGAIFIKLDENKKAKDYYKKAIEIDPNHVEAHANLSFLYIRSLDSLEKSITSSYKTLKIFHNNSKFINQRVPLYRLKHDVHQAEYLISKNYKIEGIDDFQKIGSKILERVENKEDENNYYKKILLTLVEIDTLLPFYKSDYVYKTKTISGSYINSSKNWQNVEDEYFNSSNQIMYIDNFLSDEALIELREFCLASKVWNKEYQNKYLGAFSDRGFISTIHLQIAIELKKKLPKLFGPHKIEKFWGFKYDTTLGKGINIHADDALHNLNFWITPDEYNNNKNSGGLKVYDIPAPDNWSFRDFNEKPNKIYKFLKDNNANCVNIPYKFNRAVLFNSAYFHETDEIDFKDQYEGRRINNTYLFGNRND